MKRVLPVLCPDLAYTDLAIREGTTALESWPLLTDTDLSHWRKKKNLRKICSTTANGIRKPWLISSAMSRTGLTIVLPESAHLSRDRYAEGPGIPDLHGVEVQVLGADNPGKPMPYWTALRDFWTVYFKRTGADLKSYSVLRDPPDLAH